MTQKTKIEELVIEGVTYVPKDSIPVLSGDAKIVILQRAWVYVGRLSKEGNTCRLTNAYNIRTWGTTKGLPELVHGPTSSTKLDKCEGVVEFDWLTVVHTITVNEEKWKGLL